MSLKNLRNWKSLLVTVSIFSLFVSTAYAGPKPPKKASKITAKSASLRAKNRNLVKRVVSSLVKNWNGEELPKKEDFISLTELPTFSETTKLKHLTPEYIFSSVEEATIYTASRGNNVENSLPNMQESQDFAELLGMFYKYRSIAPKGLKSDMDTLAKIAASEGSTRWVQFAILNGANPQEALLYAAGTNHIELASSLAATYKEELGNWQQFPKIQRLLENPEVAQEAKDWLQEKGVKPFTANVLPDPARNAADLDEKRDILLRNGFNVVDHSMRQLAQAAAQENNQRWVLYATANWGNPNSQMLFAATFEDKTLANYLFDYYKPDVDKEWNLYQHSILFRATTPKKQAAIPWLLEHGANPNIRNSLGETVIHKLAEQHCTDRAVWEALKAAGADFNAVDDLNRDPLSRAVFHPEVISLLLEMGATPREPMPSSQDEQADY